MHGPSIKPSHHHGETALGGGPAPRPTDEGAVQEDWKTQRDAAAAALAEADAPTISTANTSEGFVQKIQQSAQPIIDEIHKTPVRASALALVLGLVGGLLLIKRPASRHGRS